MAKTTKTPAADAEPQIETGAAPEADTASVAEAKSTAGVNAGSDEPGTLAEVEEKQGDEPTAEPAAAYSSGFDADSVAREQRAIKRQAEAMAKVNAEREAEGKDDEKQATSALDRIKRLEQRQDQLMAAVLALSDGRAVNTTALKETD